MALSSRPVAIVLRALGLGDFLTGVPALRALRAALPRHEIVLAAPAAFRPLVRLAGVADRVHPTGGLDDLRWSGPAPEIAVNLHGRGPQSHRLLLELGPQRLVAFRCDQARFAGPSWRPDEHEVARWCRLVREAVGVPADPTDLKLPAPADGPSINGAVVIHPGAAFASRRWPVERFAEVATWAASTGRRVVVTGSVAESDMAEQVAAGAGIAVSSVVAGQTTLLELAALVAAARLVICGDTGVAHLATAFGTPSVVLFGPSAPHQWGPPEGGDHKALWHGIGAGDPWGDFTDPALLEISVEEVVGAAEQLLFHCGCGSRCPDHGSADSSRGGSGC